MHENYDTQIKPITHINLHINDFLLIDAGLNVNMYYKIQGHEIQKISFRKNSLACMYVSTIDVMYNVKQS